MNTTTLKKTAEKYIDLVSQAKVLSEAIKALEDSLKNEIAEGTEIIVNGVALKHIAQDRRSFNAIVLKDLVSPAIFKKLTEVSVKASAVDSAIELGHVDADRLAPATEVKHSSYLKVVVKKS